jgi:hypothetical protein
MMPNALEALLDMTRDAALAGDLATLATLAPQVEALTAGLPRADPQTARRLLAKADRNAQLLQAASRGLRAALGRLAEITAGPTLTTYDAQGRRAAIPPLPALAPKRF